jgi:DNA-binding CsgD family transcriptional regulator
MTGHPLRPTGRQLQVLRTYIRAGTNLNAAKVLGISVRTVEAHLGTLRARLGVRNDAQAVYVLWLGYRDHVAICQEPHHETCAERQWSGLVDPRAR